MSDKWIGICDPFGLTIQADSYAELLESMVEAMDTMFTDLAQTGELEQFLAHQGWTPITPLPARSTHPRLSFDVPIKTSRIDARDLAEEFH